MLKSKPDTQAEQNCEPNGVYCDIIHPIRTAARQSFEQVIIKAYESCVETLNTQIDNLVCKITETTAAIGKVLEEKLEKLISECESVQQELDKLGGDKPRQSYETVIPLLDKFPEMPVEVRRQIAGQFISQVLMWEDRLEIQWKF